MKQAEAPKPVVKPKERQPNKPMVMRKCACGGTPGPDGMCDACRQKEEERIRRSPSKAGGHSLAHVPVQPKMEIGRPDDSYEREAEELSAKLVSGAPAKATPRSGATKLQAKGRGPVPGVPDSTASWIRGAQGRGEPLPAPARENFENKLGRSLDFVRIHRGSDAAEAADSIQANAFTFGHNIAFAPGKFAPGTPEGERLLAHELVHVLQQVPHLARDNKPDADGCFHQYREGQAWAKPEDKELYSSGLYMIIGEVREGDTLDSYLTHVADSWIVWRFGSLSGPVTSRVREAFVNRNWTSTADFSKKGCQIVVRMSIAAVNQLAAIAGRDKEGVKANKRETAAGLPELPGSGFGPSSGQQEGNSPEGQGQGEGAGQGEGQGQGEVDQQGEGQGEQQQGGAQGSANQGGGQPSEGTDSEEGGSMVGAAADPESVLMAGTAGANLPALPAKLLGPDMQVPRGIGNYTMQLDYSAISPDFLVQMGASWNYVAYHWEVYNVSSLVTEGLGDTAERQARQYDLQVDAALEASAATELRGEHAVEDLERDAEVSRKELRDPIAASNGMGATDVVTRAIVNKLNLELLPASAIIAAGGWALGGLADLFGGHEKSREVPWPNKEGYYMIRVVAAHSPQGKDDELLRASSVATKIVEVRSPAKVAQNALDEPDAQLAQLELMLVLAKTKEEKDEIQKQIDDLKLRVEGDLVQLLERALEAKKKERDGASGRARSRLDDEVEKLEIRIKHAKEQTEDVEIPRNLYRPRAVLVSRVTGEVYTLLLQIGELPKEKGRYGVVISDITTVDSESQIGRAFTLEQAFRNALREYAGQNGYGRGKLFIRMPKDHPFQNQDYEAENDPTGTKLVRERLNDLATVLAVAGLFVPGVGEIAMVVGAALAADRILRRAMNDTLDFDMALATDLIAIMGSIAQGAQIIGKIRVAKAGDKFIAAASKADQAAIDAAAAALKSATAFGKGTDIANTVMNAGGFIWGNVAVAKSLADISAAEARGEISHAEARRQRASILVQALQSNAIQIGVAMKSAKKGSGADDGLAKPPVADEAQPKKPAGDDPAQPPKKAPAEEGPGAKPGDEEGGQPKKQIPEDELKGTAKKPATDVPKKDRVVSRVTTKDGLHDVFILGDGRIYRCSRICKLLRDHYDALLKADANAELEAVDPAETNPKVLAAAKAREQRKIDAQKLLDDLAAVEKAAKDGADADSYADQKQANDDAAALDIRIRDFVGEGLAKEWKVGADRVKSMLEAVSPEVVKELRTALGEDFEGLMRSRVGTAPRDAALVFEEAKGNASREAQALALIKLAAQPGNPAVQKAAAKALASVARLLQRFGDDISAADIGKLLTDAQKAKGANLDKLFDTILDERLKYDKSQLQAKTVVDEMNDRPARRLAAEKRTPAGKVERRGYHGHIKDPAVEIDIMQNPDGVYVMPDSGYFIFHKGENVVVTIGAGPERGMIFTSYGSAGDKGPSGVKIFGGAETDPGPPITADQITQGKIPTPSGETLPKAIPLYKRNDAGELVLSREL